MALAAPTCQTDSMSFAELRHELETAPRLPEAALRRALSHADELVPVARDLIEKLKAGTYLLPDQDRLLFYGLHVLAAARSVVLFPSWCDLLRLSSDPLDDLFGDHGVPTIAAITLSLMGDDADAIFDLLAARSVSSDVRWALFPVLARQTWAGQIARGRTTAFLERFAAEELAADDDFAWHGWVDAAVLLGLTDFIPTLDRILAKPAFRYDTPAECASALARLHEAAANYDDERRFLDDGIAPIGDPVAALSWLKRIEEHDAAAAAERPAADDGPADAAADIALTETERRWLRGFLGSAQVPATTMDLETLDGFFSALIAGPETILPSDYMPYVWGGKEPADGPVFDDETQPRFLWGLLQRYWNAIARRLGEGLPHHPFLFPDGDADRGRRWATGFSIGVSLRSAAWIPLVHHRESAALPAMIMALAMHEPDYLGQPLTPALRRQMTDSLPSILLAVADFWRDAASRLDPRQPRKIGRNEPCPCGSGRKYKKCCGANAGPAVP
jgi:yecA family protein